MSLTDGSRFGSYEILSVIGEGGMGRVYRARDAKLQRIVAVKVLPDSVAGDAERIARFEREARTLAALNHPHIAQIFAVEDGAIVMEMVEGEDLAQRIARGPLSWRDALPIAKQIADALQAAHEQDIIHRDLKPANIKVTPDGAVKVLDFGLAKASAPANRGALPEGPGFSPGIMNSPTITSPAGMTQAGMILGTAAYMSPEQAKGRAADKRSDVWSFGCVLFEMVTGRRAFPGDDVMETLSAVIRADPDFSAIPSEVPLSARTLIERCLIKDRRERVADIAAAQYALRVSDTPSRAEPTTQATRFPWAIVAVAGIAAAAALAWPRVTSVPLQPLPVIRSNIAAPGAVTVGFATIAISRQGTHLAYASTQGRLQIRRLSESDARPLQGSEGGANPFFSYDGQWLAFFADGKLKKVPVAGGAAQVLADAPSGRGGSWGSDGTIVFAPSAESGLSKVSANGGAVTVLTTAKETERTHRWPQILPDGRTVIFTIQSRGRPFDDATIAAVPVAGGEPTTVVQGGSGAQFAESGHLIYARAGSLFAVAFDPAAVRPSGAAITVIDGARTNPLNGAAPFAVSSSGVFVYLPGEDTGSEMTLLTATRSGQTEVLLERRLVVNQFRISPDGGRVAVSINDGPVDLWMIDLENRGMSRFTFGSGSKTNPVWSPDGKRLYYWTNAGGGARAVSKAIDGTEDEGTVFGGTLFPTTVSPDGRTLAGRMITAASYDVVALDLAKGLPARPVAATNANEAEAVFSPDGRYLAYQSDEAGRSDVFVQAYPSGSKWQVTTTGGSEPRWTSGGRELVYRAGTAVMAVPVTLQPFSVGPAQALFTVPTLFAFDVTPDGRRFVIALDARNREDISFALITGWFEELTARMRPAP
jgi:serine/threonine-protein kinase